MNLVLLHGSLRYLFVFSVVLLVVVYFLFAFRHFKMLCIHVHHVGFKLIDEIHFSYNENRHVKICINEFTEEKNAFSVGFIHKEVLSLRSFFFKIKFL
jgi:hypothetical protein